MQRQKIVLMFLCVLMLVFLCSCTKQEVSSIGNAKDDVKVQDDKSANNQDNTSSDDTSKDGQDSSAALSSEISVELELPDGWEQVPDSNLPAHYIKDGLAVFMLNNIGFNGDNLDDVVKAIKSSNELMYQNLTYDAETENIKLDGIDARKIICSYNFNKLPMKSMFVYFFKDDETYAISFTTFLDDIDGSDNYFNSLIEDFEFILANIKIK